MFRRAQNKGLFIFPALMLVLMTCTDTSLNKDSGPTSFHLIDSARLSADGRILHMEESNGNFEFYSAEASTISRTTLDPSGHLIGYGFLDTKVPRIDDGKADPSYVNYALDIVTSSPFLELYKWYYDLSSPPQFDVEVRFGPGMTQKALRYGLDGRENSMFTEPLNFTGVLNFIDYVAVPFEVWDVTNNRQLMVSFHDENGNGVFDLEPFNQNFHCEAIQCNLSEEIIYISDKDYTVSTTINPTETPAKNLAYMVWPVRAPGGATGTQFPPLTIKISFDHYVISPSFDYSSEEVRNFSVGGKGLTLSTTDNSAHLGIQSVSSFDRSFYHTKTLVTTHQPKALVTAAGLYPLSDKGFLAANRIAGGSFDSVRFVKLDENLNPVFSAEISTDQLGASDFSAVFAETDDNKYVFLLYNPLTSVMKKFEVTPGKITLQPVTASGIDPTYPVELIKLPATSAPYRYVLLFKDGLMQLLDKDFNFVKNYAGLEHGFGVGFRACSNAAGEIFYSGSVLGGGFSGQLVMGYLDVNDAKPNYRIFDLGANILSHYSCLQPDGNAATIVQIQRSLGTQDMLFFRTDKALNTIK